MDPSLRILLGVSPLSLVQLTLEGSRVLNSSQSSNLNLHLISTNLESIHLIIGTLNH